MGQGSVHRPVLLEEAVAALEVRPGGCYVDGTFGRGGHSAAILERLGPEGCLIAFDRDEAAIEYGRERWGGDERLHLVQASFGTLAAEAERRGVKGKVDGVLLDLGVSSPQLDEAERGFSFQLEGPLDMRMDRGSGTSAADWLAQAPEEEIARVLREYGEERYARRIARAIVARRRQVPLRTTRELAELVAAAVPAREKHKHPATRTFQAIRIQVNRELDELRRGLAQAVEVLRTGGRLVVISFHSLEDRIVKRFLREQSRGERLPKGVPVTEEQLRPGALRLVGGPVRPGEAEVRENPRARSAIMRVAEKRA